MVPFARWLLLVTMLLSTTVQESPADDRLEFFEKRVRPILVDHCCDCHGADEAAGNLRLDLKSGWEQGGNNGPAIVPGQPASSLLIRAISWQHKLKMPPEDAGEQLTPSQVAALTRWVREGAVDPRTGTTAVSEIDQAATDHWAFQPVAVPEIPTDRHPIDFLVQQQQQSADFVSADRAEQQTLIRRLTFDLHGLPPTSEQLAVSPEQFPELIRDLLNSPRYGERWGRHWLDVARYSDAKDGVLMYGDARIRPFAYTYRDYVIRAFNDDKPFDQFIREQIAADQLDLPADSPDLAAMGLLTLGRMFDNNRHDVIDDQIDVVTRGFLGLTVTCARCHDHKFDPVPIADYYSLYGVFASSVEPQARPRIAQIADKGKDFETEFAAKLSEVQEKQNSHYAATTQTARERTPDYLEAVVTTEPDLAETTIFFLSLTEDQLRPQITWRWRQLIARRAFADDPVFGPWHDLMQSSELQVERWQQQGVDPRIISGLTQNPPDSPAATARRYGEILVDAWQDESVPDDDPLKALLVSRDSPVWFPAREVDRYLHRAAADAHRGLVGQLDAIAVKHADAPSRAMVLVDNEVLYDPVIFQRGDAGSRGAPVPRQFLKILSPEDRPPFQQGSGRLELAEAIASPNNPLTARVWANRVWMHHFGRSLVDNPGDFGLQTSAPRQLALLDFLADFLVQNDWRTKPLHELILTSATWQQATTVADTSVAVQQREQDPENQLLWHANRRRLDLEQMRDAILTVSGQLDLTMYGRPQVITSTDNQRRTVYAFVERQNIPAMVQTFDFANADTSTSRRVNTTVPQQALFAMNSAFMETAARQLAGKLRELDTVSQIQALYKQVLGRDGTPEEQDLAADYLQQGTLESYAQILLMSNELMFID